MKKYKNIVYVIMLIYIFITLVFTWTSYKGVVLFDSGTFLGIDSGSERIKSPTGYVEYDNSLNVAIYVLVLEVVEAIVLISCMIKKKFKIAVLVFLIVNLLLFFIPVDDSHTTGDNEYIYKNIYRVTLFYK